MPQWDSDPRPSSQKNQTKPSDASSLLGTKEAFAATISLPDVFFWALTATTAVAGGGRQQLAALQITSCDSGDGPLVSPGLMSWHTRGKPGRFSKEGPGGLGSGELTCPG